MRFRFVGIATAAVLVCAGMVNAQTLYSFEAPAVNPDGFGPNGGGVTVTQDTIGTTDGAHSMKVSVVQGATFVGALSGIVHPAIGDPPGLNTLYFDLTVDQPFTGSFAVVGVTIFGASQPDYPGGQQFGLQAQFADIEHIEGKGPGTYAVQIDLNSATHPLTLATGQTFNQIFGVVGSGVNDVIPTGVQLFFNKSNDAPLVAYIDNIRLSVPEPASLGLVAMGAVVMGAIGRRRRG